MKHILMLICLLVSIILSPFILTATDSTGGYKDISSYRSKEGIHIADAGGSYVVWIYTYTGGSVCFAANPWLGYCGCPEGYWPAFSGMGQAYNMTPWDITSYGYTCYKTPH